MFFLKGGMIFSILYLNILHSFSFSQTYSLLNGAGVNQAAPGVHNQERQESRQPARAHARQLQG